MDLYIGIPSISPISVQEVLVFTATFLLSHWFIARSSASSTTSISLPLPPGPPGLPLLGNLLSLRTDMREDFCKYTNKYGGVFRVRVGPKMIVVLTDFDAIKEAFVTKADVFSDRVTPPLLHVAVGTEGSFVFENGSVWKKRRRFGVTALRSFGVGKASNERRITEEANILCRMFENNQRISFNPKGFITNAVANIICSISFGFRYEYTDPAFQELVKNFHRAVSSVSVTSVGNMIPGLFYTPLYSKFRETILSIKSLANDVVYDHRETLDANDVRDIIDLYLLEIKRQEESGEEMIFKDKNAWRGIFDLFAAGTGTTSATLLWAILLMTKHVDVMKQVQDEIDRVIGDHRSPSISDQENMPITVATIMEVQRFRDPTPLGVPRVTSQATTLCGYHIPKGTVVLMNIWQILHSPKYWNEPAKFNPSRFLSEDGKKVIKPEVFIPFGIGLRVCLGELLAKTELFLFFTNLLQRFNFWLADDSKSVGLDGRAGIALVPHDYNIVIEKR